MSDLQLMQRISLNIMKEIDAVCRKHDIKYTLSSGSLLGAVRHKGFIPWDDDIDISMTSDNYEKFLKISHELPKNLYVENYKTEKGCPFKYTKVVDLNTTYIEEAAMDFKNKKCFGIDVFPAYGMLKKDINKKNNLLKIINNLLYLKRYFSPEQMESKSIKFKIEKNIAKLIRIEDIIKYYFLSINKMEKKGKEITNFDWLYPDRYFDYSLLEDEYSDIEFEEYSFMCIKDYDKYLKESFGDYMQLPPEEKRVPHHDYTFFDAHKSYAEYCKEKKYLAR